MSEYLLALVKVISSYDKFIEVVDIYNGIYACLFAVINNLLNSFKVFLVYRICIVISIILPQNTGIRTVLKPSAFMPSIISCVVTSAPQQVS